jgi:hypothetical protein
VKPIHGQGEFRTDLAPGQLSTQVTEALRGFNGVVTEVENGLLAKGGSQLVFRLGGPYNYVKWPWVATISWVPPQMPSRVRVSVSSNDRFTFVRSSRVVDAWNVLIETVLRAVEQSVTVR